MLEERDLSVKDVKKLKEKSTKNHAKFLKLLKVLVPEKVLKIISLVISKDIKILDLTKENMDNILFNGKKLKKSSKGNFK